MYFEFLFVAFAVLQKGAAFERLFYSQLEHIEIAGLEQIVEGPDAQGVDDALAAIDTGHHNDHGVGEITDDFAQEFDATEAGHLHV